jgi:glycosyltransferase involved in cell wall biosynthesis
MRVDCVLAYHIPEKYVFDAVRSALTQTHQDLHLHIIDDSGGNGMTDELEKEFPDSRITFYHNIKNIGFYQSVNDVFWNFKGELFFIFDSDDISPNWRLADAIEVYQKESFDVYTAGIRWIAEDSQITDKYGIPEPLVFDEHGRQVKGQFFNPSCCIRSDYFRDIGGYSDCFVGGDKDFATKSYYYKAKFYYDSQRVMAYRREHPQQVTKTEATGMRSKQRWQIHEKIRRRVQKYYLGGNRRRIRKCGCLRLTTSGEAIPI